MQGIQANHAPLAERVAESVSLVTALNLDGAEPIIGYEKTALIAKTALAIGGTLAEVAESLGIMGRAGMKCAAGARDAGPADAAGGMKVASHPPPGPAGKLWQTLALRATTCLPVGPHP